MGKWTTLILAGGVAYFLYRGYQAQKAMAVARASLPGQPQRSPFSYPGVL